MSLGKNMIHLQPGGRGWGRNLQKFRHGLKTQTQSEEAGFKEKLIQVEGLHIFNFKVLISDKISWTDNGMHTHVEMLLPTCWPHFQGKEGPAPRLREKGQRHQGLTAFFKASLLLPVNQISPP